MRSVLGWREKRHNNYPLVTSECGELAALDNPTSFFKRPLLGPFKAIAMQTSRIPFFTTVTDLCFGHPGFMFAQRQCLACSLTPPRQPQNL